MIYQRVKIARGQGAKLVAGAVVDKESAFDDNGPAREADTAIEPLDFVIGFRLHEPVGSAMQNLGRVLEVEQQRAEAIKLIRADSMINREPSVWSLDRGNIDAELGCLPRVLVLN